MELQAGNLRMASYRIHQSLVEKPIPIEDYWPLRSDKKKEPDEKIMMTPEMYNDIKKIHNL